ncbi:MAG: alpha-tubulin suppressor-like RCC1 family protein [Myxococcota bacterium]|jgi:alpha-tubulin suppressor-like RCC1 family protein
MTRPPICLPTTRPLARSLTLLALVLASTGCPSDEAPQTSDTTSSDTSDTALDTGPGEDTQPSDTALDTGSDTGIEDTVQSTITCEALRSEPASFELGASHDVAIIIQCDGAFAASCVAGSCAQLQRPELAGQPALSDAGVDLLGQDGAGATYAVRFAALASPPSQPNADGVIEALGVEPLTLSMSTVTDQMTVSIGWAMSDVALAALNQPDPEDFSLPEAFRGPRDPSDPERLIALHGVRVGAAPDATADEHTLLLAAKGMGQQVQLLGKAPGADVETLVTLPVSAGLLQSPAFDVVDSSSGRTVYFSAHNADENTFVGAYATLDLDGQLVDSGVFDATEAGEIAGLYPGYAIAGGADEDVNISFGAGVKEVMLNIGFKSEGKLVALRTSLPTGVGAPATVQALSIRSQSNADVADNADNYEHIGIVDAGVSATTPILWRVPMDAEGISIEVVATKQVATTGGDALQVSEVLVDQPLDFVQDPATLRVERLVQRNGTPIGLVAHADGGVMVLQRNAKGVWSEPIMLPTPNGLTLGLDTDTATGQAASTSFVLNGTQVVALGRWPWNWRDKLNYAQNLPTFAVRWDLTSQEIVSVSMARVAASQDGAGNPNLEALTGLNPSQSLSADGSRARSGSLDTTTSCVDAKDCFLVSSLPSGEGLYLAGGATGPTLRAGKYGDILIDGVPLEFDVIASTQPPLWLVGPPAMMGQPGGGAFVLLPVGDQTGGQKQTAIWLMSDDGTITPTASTLSRVNAIDNLANDGQHPLASVDGLELLVPDGQRPNAPDEATFSIVTAADLAGAAASAEQAVDVVAATGAFNFKDASFHVAEQQRRARQAPLFFARAESLTLRPAKHLGVGAAAAQAFEPDVTMIEEVTSDTRLLLGHMGTGCGALTLAAIGDDGPAAPGLRTLLERTPDEGCADEVIIGAGRFLTTDKFAVATYVPATQEVLLTYLVGDSGGPLTAQTIGYSGLAGAGDTIPQFRVGDTNGDGLDDIIAEGAWQDGARVVVWGDGAAVVKVVGAPPVTFHSNLDASQNTAAPTPAPSSPTIQFAGMASSGPPAISTSAGAYTKVAAGGTHTCALKANGAILCWGLDGSGQSSPPAGTFKDVAAGQSFSCGLETGGAIVCWGSNISGEATPPTGTFKKIDSENQVSCGIRTDDTLACWGNQPRVTAPTGTYDKVAVVSSGVCAIALDGTLTCWGGTLITNTMPTGTFVDIAMGRNTWSCGVRTDGTAVCWGIQNGEAQPAAGNYSQVAVGFGHACLIKTDGTLLCWGINNVGQTDAPAGTFVQISSGPLHTCGVRTDGSVSCWGRNVAGESTVPKSSWHDLYPGHGTTCGIKDDGTVACWGAPHVPSPPASATFVDVAMGDSGGAGGVCGVETSGVISCWGPLTWPQLNPPSGTFTQVTLGWWHGCALTPNGQVACWGLVTAPVAGTFKQITGGTNFSCGLTTADTVDCWEQWPALGTPPAGTFQSLEGGWRHMCGLRSNGDAECWGGGTDPWAVAPAGAFTELAAGANHTCGLKPDGSIQCWGDNWRGQLNSPAGAFVRMRAGFAHTCAMRADNTWVCWGSNVSGQCTIPPS